MSQGRYDHASGLLTDNITQEKFLVVTGGWSSDDNVLMSTLFLVKNRWLKGIQSRSNHIEERQTEVQPIYTVIIV